MSSQYALNNQTISSEILIKDEVICRNQDQMSGTDF